MAGWRNSPSSAGAPGSYGYVRGRLHDNCTFKISCFLMAPVMMNPPCTASADGLHRPQQALQAGQRSLPRLPDAVRTDAMSPAGIGTFGPRHGLDERRRKPVVINDEGPKLGVHPLRASPHVDSVCLRVMAIEDFDTAQQIRHILICFRQYGTPLQRQAATAFPHLENPAISHRVHGVDRPHVHYLPKEIVPSVLTRRR